MRVVGWPEADVPEALRRQVLALQDRAWPGTAPTPYGPVHDPALRPYSMLLVDGGTVVAALDVLSKPLVHAGWTYAASGLATVVTDSARRGEGHGSRLVRAAYEHIAASGADLGIFTCDSPLQVFYERVGWTHLPGTVLVGGTPSAPFPSDVLGKVVLGASFTARTDLRSLVGARLELYPGEVDRLW